MKFNLFHIEIGTFEYLAFWFTVYALLLARFGPMIWSYLAKPSAPLNLAPPPPSAKDPLGTRCPSRLDLSVHVHVTASAHPRPSTSTQNG
jgi:hypothetical protein